MHDPTSPRRISSPSALPEPSRCSWPRKSSSVFGLIRAASGSGEPWNKVGSFTIGMRDAGCVQIARKCKNAVMSRALAEVTFDDVSKLERLDTWRGAQDLAYHAYLLTLSPQLSKHFALIDQIRRAALSVPANIPEGYSLGTTPQFLRGLKIALGSNTELYSHLAVLVRLELVSTEEVFPFPASRFPTNAPPPTTSS